MGGEKGQNVFVKADIIFLVFVYSYYFVNSRIVTLNSACWSISHNRYCLPLEFFPILPVLATFWIAKTPIFFPFSNPQFLRNSTRWFYVHQFDLDCWAKTHCQPIIRHCLGCCFTISSDFLWKSALIPEIWAENRKNFNKISDVSDSENEKQMLVMCAWVCAIVSWNYEYLMSSKTGNSANVFWR